ncbi:MAG: signal peptidase II [Bacillota bacterium]
MLFWLTFLAVFLADQASKMFIMGNMFLNQSIPVITNVFHITYIRNPGAAFGLMAYRTSFFIAVSILVVLGIIVFYKKYGGKGTVQVTLGLIAGGALGNLVDRVRFGEVVDFLDFRVWPVFNLADSAIVVGAALLVLVFWRLEGKT